MHLLKDGLPILTARSEHTENNSGHDFPITYEGDASLLGDDVDCLSVGILEGIMMRIAIEHGFTMSGDYANMTWDSMSEYEPSPQALRRLSVSDQ